MRTMFWLIPLSLLLTGESRLRAQPASEQLAEQARSFLLKHCHRCHGQNGASEGGFNHALDFKLLVEKKKVLPGDAVKSKLFRRVSNGTMPPEEEKVRPTPDEIAMLKRWIEAGAPAPTVVTARTRAFRTLKDDLTAIRDDLRRQPREQRPHIRYFTLTHLHNLPADRVGEADLRIYRAALSKLGNSLSWKHAIVIPAPLDQQETILAVNLRHLDWDRKNLWQEILKVNPYGLAHTQNPDDPAVNDLATEIKELCGTDVPMVRADWFIATAARPPLYHTLLQLPEKASELEKQLNVDVKDNFVRGQAARAGFNASGVSAHNRLVERHAAAHGAYWKSYDFKTSAGRGNIFVFPLGPEFDGHPFERQAFKHDGGEIIWNLPNGLQGYLLVDGKDQRINEGPIEVVSDGKKISGTPLIVNGLSCMACHLHGVIRLQDQIRGGTILGGNARDKVRELHPPTETMNALLKKDEDRFLRALAEAMDPFLKVGPDAQRDIRDFPEPVAAIARWYIQQELTLDEAARELGLADSKVLQTAVQNNARLQELGLFPLASGGTIKREVWETLEFFTSPFQEAARELKLGTPRRVQ